MASRRTKLAKLSWVTLLAVATGCFAWLWLASHTSTPKRLYHSTDRYCSWIGFQNGQFVYWYDGGSDVKTFVPRNFKLLGIFVKASVSFNSWQYFSAGIHGGYACGWLAALWSPTIWLIAIRPWVRKRGGRCVRCGYDLRGVRDPVCPECGRPEAAPNGRR